MTQGRRQCPPEAPCVIAPPDRLEAEPVARRRRIALILPGDPALGSAGTAALRRPCGVEDHTAGLARALARLAEVTVVVAGDPSRLADLDGLPGLCVRRVAPRWNSWHCVPAMADAAASAGPDLALIQYMPYLLHPRGVSFAGLFLASRLRRRGVKVGVVMHEVVSPPRLGTPWSIPRAAAQSAIASWMGTLADVVVVSSRDRSDLMARLLCAAARVRLVPVGSNIPSVILTSQQRQALRAQWGVPAGAFVMAHFGKDHDSKMPTLALDALEAVRRSGIDARLIVIGDQPLPEHAAIVRLGFLPAIDVAQALAASDLYLLPLRDGVSTRRTTLAAALALRLPVLTTRGPHTDLDLLGTGVVALAAASSRAFADAARDLAVDAIRRERLACQGVQFHARELQWDVIARRFRDLCELSDRPAAALTLAQVPCRPLGPSDSCADERSSAGAAQTFARSITRASAGLRARARERARFRVPVLARQGCSDSRPLHIAMVHVDLPGETYGGVAHQVHHLANALAKRGHTVTVVTASPAAPGALYTVRRVTIPERIHRSKVARLFLAARSLAAAIPADAGVVHFHGDDHWPRPEVPAVRTFYGSALFEMLSAVTWRRRASQLAAYALEWAGGLRADVTVAISRDTTRALPFVERVIGCGFDPAVFSPASGASHGARRSREPSILFVGTLGGRKRGALLLEAFASKVRARHPHAQLWLVCDPPPAAPAAGGVSFLGHVSTPDLARLYREAWVFALPSSYEGFGVPYLEALASGTPVVATPNAGACALLGNTHAGVIVEPGDLGGTLADLLEDEPRRSAMERAALSVAQRHTIERVAAAYEEVYREAIARRTTRTAADDHRGSRVCERGLGNSSDTQIRDGRNRDGVLDGEAREGSLGRPARGGAEAWGPVAAGAAGRGAGWNH